MGNIEKVIIIGTGAAGLAAAIYAARANLAPLVIEGPQGGGQLTTTTLVENYPGFKDGIMGPQLMEDMRAQAIRVGANIVSGVVNKVDFSVKPYKIYVDSEEKLAHTVIIATGASARYLNIPSEKKYIGFGISTCATCDGFFYRGKEVLVVGGGDTAMEDSNYLATLANKVTIVHRRKEFRASPFMLNKAKNNPKIQIITDSTIDEFLGDGKIVSGAKLKNLVTGQTQEMTADGVFLAIGHHPNTELFKRILDIDEQGYLITKDTITKIPGIYAAGDVQDHRYRQAITSAGTGCMAALNAQRYLETENII
jgi:thioredoxin reductase (NADPH)